MCHNGTSNAAIFAYTDPDHNAPGIRADLRVAIIDYLYGERFFIDVDDHLIMESNRWPKGIIAAASLYSRKRLRKYCQGTHRVRNIFSHDLDPNGHPAGCVQIIMEENLCDEMWRILRQFLMAELLNHHIRDVTMTVVRKQDATVVTEAATEIRGA